MWKNHPKGLAVLFFTEMWERFGYYTMLAILALYMDEHFHLSKQVSGNIYGIFIAFVYFSPLLGGFLADKVLGYKKAILIGAILMAIGYTTLGVNSMNIFYLALGIIVLGNGFFKPNISALLGNLYRDDDPNKDAGYNIFYMGINVGAFFSPIAASYMRNNFGWWYAFAAAGAGMLLSIVIFQLFKKHVTVKVKDAVDQKKTTAPLTIKQERTRVVALIIIFAIVVLFWMAFHQNGFTMTFWARDCTITNWSPELFQTINPFFVVFFTPLLVGLWSLLRKKGKEPSTPAKLMWGMTLTAAAYAIMMFAGQAGGDTGKVASSWLISSYAVITLGELCLSPMGLSLVSKMAPVRLRGILMGGWFAATAVGNYLSGFMGSFWDNMPHSKFFGILVLTSLVAVVLLWIVMGKIKRAMDTQNTSGTSAELAPVPVVAED